VKLPKGVLSVLTCPHQLVQELQLSPWIGPEARVKCRVALCEHLRLKGQERTNEGKRQRCPSFSPVSPGLMPTSYARNHDQHNG
jgi:hypothetical protein